MRYHNITKDDMLNGDGLRAVLWVSGCEHRCPNCQNPMTWDENDGLIFDWYAMKELADLLQQDYIHGLTLSGGDPLHPANREEVYALCCMVKTMFPTKSIWLYTGYKWEEICDMRIMECVDVVIDGPYIEQLRDVQLKWRGSSNQRIIDVKASRNNGTVVLYDE